MRLFKPRKRVVAPERIAIPERVVATIGEAGHGKTTFLTCLFWDSFFTLSTTFQDGRQPYFVNAKDDDASDLFYGNAKDLNQLILPIPNPLSRSKPAVFEFNGAVIIVSAMAPLQAALRPLFERFAAGRAGTSR